MMIAIQTFWSNFHKNIFSFYITQKNALFKIKILEAVLKPLPKIIMEEKLTVTALTLTKFTPHLVSRLMIPINNHIKTKNKI